uniref:Uncharacterized protein n=1 Tax=Candidatus Kentrum sp. DK TaxID=2126562 RepID=A0A450SEW2_9GAMM|nr:MAG: hypothetical protein BECKDK2373B_GA0170837_103238 [Candidatus Kentron sp. DK]
MFSVISVDLFFFFLIFVVCVFGCGPRSLSDLGVRREGKRDRDQNLCKFEANSELFNENLRGFWPISAFPQQNHPKSDRLLVQLRLNIPIPIRRGCRLG